MGEVQIMDQHNYMMIEMDWKMVGLVEEEMNDKICLFMYYLY